MNNFVSKLSIAMSDAKRKLYLSTDKRLTQRGWHY